MSFYLPTSTGEWLAFASGVVTVLFGLILFVAPGLGLRMLRLRPVDGHPEAVGEGRATLAGFYIGVGLAALVLAQPLVWLALAAGWTMTAVGRLVAIVADRGFTPFNLVALGVEVILAALPAAYALGYG